MTSVADKPRQDMARTGEVVTPQPTVITTPAEYQQSLSRWNAERYNVLTPFTNVSGLAAQHGIIASKVQINPDPAAGDVYTGTPFVKGENVALAKRGLRKIAECAGISIRTVRVDTRTIRNYWEFKAVATYRGVDGSVVTREASADFDLRDGSERIRGFSVNQISQARVTGLRGAESRAINAVIRECGCGLPHTYTKAELARPFVVVRVMFIPDMSNPEVAKLVAAQALQGTSALYAQTAAAALPAPVLQDAFAGDDEVHVGSGSTGDRRSAPAPITVTEVAPKSGETNGRKWTVYRISLSDGRYGGTFDAKLAEKAMTAKNDGVVVRRAEIDESGKNPNLTTLELVTDEEDVALPLEIPDLNGPGEMKL